MAKKPGMKIWHVADQQNCFETYRYAKRLARLQEKAGYRVKVWSEGFKDAEEMLAEKKPDMLHLHYHPQARKFRHVIKVAEGYGVPVMMTYHEVTRTPPERQEHLEKCLSRTRYAFFLTKADREAAVAVNPRLERASRVAPMPPPDDIPEELPDIKSRQLEAYAAGDRHECIILYVDMIAPGRGVEALLDMAAAFPSGTTLLLAGAVPAGEGSFARYVKARVKYDRLPVELAISKRKFGHKQMCNVVARADFAYHPGGEVGAEGYGGATLHSMTIPYYNAMRLLVFGHRGLHTEAEAEKAMHLLDMPEDLLTAVHFYHDNPEKWRVRLDEAEQFARRTSWAELVKVTGEQYKKIVK